MTLVLDHYLEVLHRKPGAVPGATALTQARAAGVFTAEHEAWRQISFEPTNDPSLTPFSESLDVMGDGAQ